MEGEMGQQMFEIYFDWLVDWRKRKEIRGIFIFSVEENQEIIGILRNEKKRIVFYIECNDSLYFILNAIRINYFY